MTHVQHRETPTDSDYGGSIYDVHIDPLPADMITAAAVVRERCPDADAILAALGIGEAA